MGALATGSCVWSGLTLHAGCAYRSRRPTRVNTAERRANITKPTHGHEAGSSSPPQPLAHARAAAFSSVHSRRRTPR
eukprot:236084-Pleurochrysis_carterae.AAC.3